MTRPVKPWVGTTDSTMPPPRVRLRIFTAYGGKCQITGREITPQDRWCLDHKIAIINNGKNEEANLWPVLEEAHKSKTVSDVAEKAAVAAKAKSHLGIKGKPTPLSGRTRVEIESDRNERTKARGGKPSVVRPDGYLGSFRIREIKSETARKAPS